MKNKKIIIIAGVFVALALIVIATLLIRQKNQRLVSSFQPVARESFKADFLTQEDKQKIETNYGIQLPDDLRVQATKRDSQGEVMVYKIIRKDSDIIDPAKVKSLSPRLGN